MDASAQYIVVALLGLLSLLMFVMWVYALVDCLKSQFKDSGSKVAWVLALLFLPVLGFIIYMIFAKQTKLGGRRLKIYMKMNPNAGRSVAR
ncbi:MAG: PLDc_N domain-containing protein [Opitutae bacterium]|nr:PLDc_N domain-containing protein [Opitutae bacterium]